MPIFRSRHQAQLLAELYLHLDREVTITELADIVGVPLTTAATEINRLVEAGLLHARPLGRARLVRANASHPAAGPLAELLNLSFGPPSVLTEEFSGLDGALKVILFGSWAARFAGVTGPPPADIDVLVVGRPRRSDVYAAAERAQVRLRTPVNPVLRSQEQWSAGAADADALVADVREGQHLVLVDHTGTEGADS